MAGEHWNFGFVEAVAAVGDVMADDMLRMRGFSIIGEPVSGSDVGETSSMFSRLGMYPRGPGVGTESSSYSISWTSNDNPLSAVLAVLAVS
jgi:hypothetical protein